MSPVRQIRRMIRAIKRLEDTSTFWLPKMLTHAQLRTILILAAIAVVLPAYAEGAVGDKGSMNDACRSGDAGLQALCQMVNDQFKADQGSYVHLGGDFYVVSVSDTARVVQGIYVGNIKSRGLNQFGGYGSAEFSDVLLTERGAAWIGVKSASMNRGQFYEGESLLERRVNPLIKTPFLIRHHVRGATGLSEERQGFCARTENRDKAECGGLGEVAFADRDDLVARRNAPAGMEAMFVKRILAAHDSALRAYKSKDFEGKQPFELLEEAGIWRILDARPNALSEDRYVQILNDYALFAYQYGEGRTDLAIEILDKVVALRPGRAVAYLNMADALDYLAEFGATQYSTIPLDEQAIIALRGFARDFRGKHQSFRGQAK